MGLGAHDLGGSSSKIKASMHTEEVCQSIETMCLDCVWQIWGLGFCEGVGFLGFRRLSNCGGGGGGVLGFFTI